MTKVDIYVGSGNLSFREAGICYPRLDGRPSERRPTLRSVSGEWDDAAVVDGVDPASGDEAAALEALAVAEAEAAWKAERSERRAVEDERRRERDQQRREQVDEDRRFWADRCENPPPYITLSPEELVHVNRLVRAKWGLEPKT